LLVCFGLAVAGNACAAVPDAHSAATLFAQYASLADRLHNSPFNRALHLDSSESDRSLRGDIYAIVEHPFAAVSVALRDPDHWCDVLILHINTKHCGAATGKTPAVLTVRIGRKTSQPLEDAYPIRFAYRAAAVTPKYLDVQLDAENGPMSTSNYRIRLQAVPVDGTRTFLHLTYSYDYGMAGRLAMKTYLSTIGSDKVGFTLTGEQSDGKPKHIGGMRGVVERNAMRYYLAVDSYLDALGEPPSLRLEKRLQGWFAATEQYPRQLHELDRTAYLDMKRSEYLRQQRLH
jgi:hypothetical protein